MNKLPCRHAVVQFVPYAETCEFVGARVVRVCPRTGRVGFRVPRREPDDIDAHGDAWVHKLRRLRSRRLLPAGLLFAFAAPDQKRREAACRRAGDPHRAGRAGRADGPRGCGGPDRRFAVR